MKGGSIYNQQNVKKSPAECRTFTEFQQANLHQLSLKFPFLGKSQVRAKLKEQWNAYHKPKTKTSKVKKKGKQDGSICDKIDVTGKKCFKEDPDIRDNGYISTKPLPHNYRDTSVAEISASNESFSSCSSRSSSSSNKSFNTPEDHTAHHDQGTEKENTVRSVDNQELGQSLHVMDPQLSSKSCVEMQMATEGTHNDTPVENADDDDDIDFKITPISPDKVKRLVCRRPKWGRSRLRIRKSAKSILRDITNEFNCPIILGGSSDDEEILVDDGNKVQPVRQPLCSTDPSQQELSQPPEDGEDDGIAKWNQLLLKRETWQETWQGNGIQSEDALSGSSLHLNDPNKEIVTPTCANHASSHLPSKSPTKQINEQTHVSVVSTSDPPATRAGRIGRLKKNVKTKVKEWEESVEEIGADVDDDGDSGFLTDLFTKPTEVAQKCKFKTPSIGVKSSLEGTKDMFAGTTEEFFG